MTKYRKHTKIAEQEQEQQQFSNFLDRARYSHGQLLTSKKKLMSASSESSYLQIAKSLDSKFALISCSIFEEMPP